MIEVERKYRLQDTEVNTIKEKLLKLTPQAPTIRQIDTVYLRGIDSFKDFQSGMAVVRIRTENNTSKLTYKKSINQSGDAIEHEVTIDNAQVMNDILRADDYRIVTQVTKDRLEVSDGHITYALDNVEHLGWFLEIETLIPDTASLQDAEDGIKAAAASLQLSDDMIEPKKYDQLLASIQ